MASSQSKSLKAQAYKGRSSELYRSRGRRKVNRIRDLERHLRTNPNDQVAANALKSWQSRVA